MTRKFQRREFLTGVASLLGGSMLAPACDFPGSASTGSIGEKITARRNAFERAEAGIGKHRQGNAVIRLVDANNQPVKGLRLTINQLRHDFRFGCYLTFRELSPANREMYQQQFSRLFNYGTVGVYWDLIQSVKHIADWDQVKPEIDWATKQGLKLKGHPLVWGCERAGTPRWLPRQRTELQTALDTRVRDAVSRYRGQVTTWDVVNEPLEKGLFEEILGSDYLRQAFTIARDADPTAQLVVNEYGILGAQSVKRDSYFALLKKIKDDGVPFDVVGIQAHEPRDEWFDPAIVTSTLDQFADLGKTIHLTEFTAQSDSRAAITGGYREGKWDRARQAQYFVEFYTLCFGHPQVEAITVWGLDDERAWINECALLGQDWLPKQAWRALDQLLNLKWRTNTETLIEKEEYRLRGFYGEYEVKVTLKNQKEIKQQFPLRRGEKNEWQIRI